MEAWLALRDRPQDINQQMTTWLYTAFSLACVAYIESVDHAGSQVMQAVKSCRQSTLSVTPKPPPHAPSPPITD